MAEHRFPALHTAASILRLLTWIVVAGCALGGISAAAQGSVAGSVGFAIAATVAWLSGMILPEGIAVALAIEENTRSAAEALRSPERPAGTSPSPTDSANGGEAATDVG